MIDLKAMGARIRQARHAQGLTQAALAEMCGVTGATIGRVERGETAPRVWLLLRLSETLGQWPEFLLVGRTPVFDVAVTVTEKQSPADLDRLMVDTARLLNGLVDGPSGEDQ